jgi:hypothetical protein
MMRAVRKQLDGVKVEDALGLRLVAVGHVVAGQAQYVADAHRRRAQQVALDGDAVAVAAGDLEDGLVAGARQQGADGDAGHVAVGPTGVGGVDGIADSGQRYGRVVDLLRDRRCRAGSARPSQQSGPTATPVRGGYRICT